MYEAFESLDYHVILLAGSLTERLGVMRSIKRRVSEGLLIDFVYIENTNAPICLAEGGVPCNSFRDYVFLAWLRSNNIPIGVFYRDVYWKFDFYSELLPWPLCYLTRPLCYLDWYMYDRFSDVFFLPSLLMNEYLPKPRGSGKVFELPPGFGAGYGKGEVRDAYAGQMLKLLYVGGVSPHVYDLSGMLSTILRIDGVKLTICCREDEWRVDGAEYRLLMEGSDKIDVVHFQGDQLAELYSQNDVFMMAVNYSEYRDFSMPIKFFEAIGYGLPIVSLYQKAIASLINEFKIGWVLESEDELIELLSGMVCDRSEVSERSENVALAQSQFTWKTRAATVPIYLNRNKVNVS
ncbi:hypothetical protein A9Q99_03550 [Gammaproteobacteria bacterium 45_16_T64]|nr:hypothetical protein A9Q99_03550 [Gammaproteobacteria bacterium 45_16_T64]